MHIHRKLFIEKTSHNNYSHMFQARQSGWEKFSLRRRGRPVIWRPMFMFARRFLQQFIYDFMGRAGFMVGCCPIIVSHSVMTTHDDDFAGVKDNSQLD